MNIAHIVLALAVSFAISLPASAAVWQSTSTLITPRGGAGVMEVGGKLYAIGGVDGIKFLSSSEYSTINADGTLAAWKAGTALTEERGFFGVAAHKGFIYAVGGGNGPNGHNLLRSVERAALLSDGGLGAWKRESAQLNLPRRCAKVIVIGEYLYAFGGFGGTLLDTVERARIQADGSLAAWEVLPVKFNITRYIHAMAKTNDGLYAVGGHADQGGTGIAAVEYAGFAADGNVSKWQMTASLKQGRYGLAAVAHGGYVYALGGLNGATFYDVIERSRIGPGGTLEAWQNITPLPAPFADIGVANYRDWVYVVGGTNQEGYFNSVFVARFDGQGNLATTGADSSTQAPQPAKPILVPNEGVVLQTLDGGAYTYVEVDTGEGKEWLAGAQSKLVPGDRVRYSLGIFMKDFYSKQLQRRFDIIRFVGKLEKLGQSE